MKLTIESLFKLAMIYYRRQKISLFRAYFTVTVYHFKSLLRAAPTENVEDSMHWVVI